MFRWSFFTIGFTDYSPPVVDYTCAHTHTLSLTHLHTRKYTHKNLCLHEQLALFQQTAMTAPAPIVSLMHYCAQYLSQLSVNTQSLHMTMKIFHSFTSDISSAFALVNKSRSGSPIPYKLEHLFNLFLCTNGQLVFFNMWRVGSPSLLIHHSFAIKQQCCIALV